jgi:hypothetical protein
MYYHIRFKYIASLTYKKLIIGRENTPKSGSQQKRHKGKGKATDSELLPDMQDEVGSTSEIGLSVTDEPSLANTITFDDYDFDYSGDFYEPIVQRPILGESSKSTFLPESSKSSSTAAKSSSPAVKSTSPALSSSPSAIASMTADKASASEASSNDTTKGLEMTSKRVMTIKSTVKSIWKPAYLQPLYDLVNITHVLVTHTFAFSKYIFYRSWQ